mgnify:CR=1 FL=1
MINNCEICQLTKYDRRPLKLQYNLTPTATRPFQLLHMDSITLENCKFLPIIDSFSKYAQAYKLNSAQGIEVANNLIKYFIHQRIPKQIISDNGTELNNSVVQELLKTHNKNGVIEKFHYTLIEHLRLLNNQEEYKNESIEIKVNYALLAYNNTIHSATNLKPYEIVTGHLETDSPFNIKLENQVTNIEKHKDKVKIMYKKINLNVQI